MTYLLTFRDNVKAFFSRYAYVTTPLMKGILAFCIFLSLNTSMPYVPVLNHRLILLLLAAVCAFLPLEVITGISAIMLILQSFKVSADTAFLCLALILIFYCGYMRFVPKTGVIALVVPVLSACHMLYAVPVLVILIAGPAAVIPTVFGVILYYYEQSLGELVNVLAATTEEDEAVQGFQYILSELLDNKEMLLTIVVFAVVTLIGSMIYRMSVEHAWMIALIASGFLNIILFLVGSVTVGIEVSIGAILLQSIVGVLIAGLGQFFKGIVDYQRTELLQFEDDAYYYYVKAVPKLSVSESNKNVKYINSKKHN